MRVGLFGGSFDPAHEGHAHVALTALKRLGLDKIWWLVTPQNPLKPQSSPLAARLASARRFARGMRMEASDVETRLGTQYTADTLEALRAHYPGVAFTFIMGADSAASFRRWARWREIAAKTDIVVIPRPGAGVRERMAAPKGFRYLLARLDPHSSTALRSGKAEH